MRLYLVRHPRPVVGPEVCYGRTDLAVAPPVLRDLLPTLLPQLPQEPATPVFSSPLRRCAVLAESIAAARAAAAPTYDARLAELDFGAWESRPWSGIPRAEVDAWADDPVHYRPGGGESVLGMAQRVHAFHEALAASGCARAIVVCHAGTIRLLAARGHGMRPEEMALQAVRRGHAIAYGAVTVVDCRVDGL